MHYQEYIKTELLILIPVLYFIGIGLKKSRLPDNWIPALLGMISILLSTAWVMATGEIANLQELSNALFTAVTQGVLLAGASVYANQLYVQAKKEE
jgi:hypothetical protein